MKSRIILNFNDLKGICDNTERYMNALTEIKYALDKINSRLENENSGEAVNALIDSYKDLEQDLKSCYNEVSDLNSIFTSYMNEMGAIISPVNADVNMKIDRDDIWWNIDSVRGACDSIANMPAIFNGNIFSSELTDEQKQNQLKNSIKVQEINRLMKRYKYILQDSYTDLAKLFNTKIVDFEDKDDEFARKAKKDIYNSYTSIWERMNDWLTGAADVVYDTVRAVVGVIWDTLKGIVSLAVGLVKGLGTYAVAFCGDVYSSVNCDVPDWLQNVRSSRDDINNTVKAVISDPIILVEGMAESIHNAYEEEGIVYCTAYAVGDLLGLKGLGKLANASKVSKASKTLDVATDAVKTVKAMDTIHDVDKVADVARTAKVTDVATDAVKTAKVMDTIHDVDKITDAAKTAKAVDVQDEIRKRVLKNIKESKLARESSNYSEFARIEKKINNNISNKLDNVIILEEENYALKVKEILKSIENSSNTVNTSANIDEIVKVDKVIDTFKLSDNMEVINNLESAHKWGNKYYDNWINSLSEKQYNALRQYTSGDYSLINSTLRGNKNPLLPDVDPNVIKSIKNALSNSSTPYNMKVYRGTDLKPFKNLLFADEYGKLDYNLLVGNVIKENGFLSTSVLREGSFNYHQVNWEIHVPKGCNGAYIAELSNYPEEAELLINAGQELLIKSVEAVDDGNINIILEVLRKDR